jgi:hypothetical protein
MELARLLNIREYPSPGGGCLLTDKAFSGRLRDLFDSKNSPDVQEIELLKYGRHFRINSHTKAVVGRNKKENQAILALAGDKDLVITSANAPGPITVVLGDCSKKSLELATAITVAYSDTEDSKTAPVRIVGRSGEEIWMTKVYDKEKFRRYMI